LIHFYKRLFQKQKYCKMTDISNAELKKEIQEILKDADLDNTSAKKVRLQLQEKLDVDLADRKKEVDQLVMEVIDEQTQEEEGSEEEEEEEEKEEKPQKKPAAKKAAPKRKASPSGSEGEDEEDGEGGSDEEEEAVPSDGGGSDYEPDQPVKVNRGRKAPAKKSKAKYGSDDEGSSGEEWGAAKKSSAKKGRKKKADSDDDDSDYEKPKKKKTKTKKDGKERKAGGYTAPVKLSGELSDIVGGDEMPRHEVVKRMWAYIKENKLQDPKNKQMIKCDDKLGKIIPTKKFRGFGMTKYLKDHMNVDEAGKSIAKKKAVKAESEDDSDGGSE